MLVDVVLYKTKLSTTDTMVFDGDTAEEVRANQSAFFATLEKKTFTEKLSFNGRRSLRIKGNYWLLNLDGYNYCTITYSNKTYFCFIDKFTYVNDNCTQLDVTTDYIQTYLTEIKFSQLFIDQRNYSLNITNFYQYKPYKNFYPISTQKEISKTDLHSNYILATVLCNKTGKLDNIDSPIMFPLSGQPQEFTTQRNIVCLAWLYELEEDNDNYPKITPISFLSNKEMSLGYFLNNYGANVIDITFSDVVARDVEDTGSTRVVKNLNMSQYNIDSSIDAGIVSAITGTTKENLATKLLLDIPSTIKPSLLVSPYYNMYTYRKGKSVNLINPANLKFYLGTNKFYTRYRTYYSFFPDYATVIDFEDNINKKEVFPLGSYCENVVYTVSAWEQYKLNNSATVGDALSTKHAYDMEIAERNYQNQKNIAETKRKIGGVDAGLGGLGNLYGGLGAVLGGNPAGVGQFVSGITSSITGAVKTGLTYEQDLENATVAYENAKTTIAQESALLQLEYNDIKNAPDVVRNLTGNGYLDIAIDRRAKIATYEASNIEEVIKYHKRFGFETSLQTDITTINGMHDTDAQHFDYIRTMNANVISENIPKQSADIIAKIFDSGIYLWRNYEKLGEDYFSNYAGE